MAVEGKVAVVTGASRGIGKQTCILLAQRGVQLVLAARTEEPRAGTPGTLGETADELPPRSGPTRWSCAPTSQMRTTWSAWCPTRSIASAASTSS